MTELLTTTSTTPTNTTEVPTTTQTNTTEVLTTTLTKTTEVPSFTPTNTTEVSTIISTTPTSTTEVPTTTQTNTTKVLRTTPTNTTEVPSSTPTNSTEMPTTTSTNTTEVSATTSTTPTNMTEVPTMTQMNTTEVPSSTPTNTTEVSTTTLNTPTNTTEVPTTTQTNITEVLTTTPTNTTEVPSFTPTNTTEVPTTSPTNTTDVPSTTPTNTTEVPTTTPENTTEISAITTKVSIITSTTPTNTTEVPRTTPLNTTEVLSSTPTNTTEVPTTPPKNTTEVPSTTPTNTTEMSTATPVNTTEVLSTTSTTPTNTNEVPTMTQMNTTEVPSSTPTNTTEVSATTSNTPSNTTEVSTTTLSTSTNTTEVSTTTPKITTDVPSTTPTNTTDVPITTSTTPTNTTEIPTTAPKNTTEVPSNTPTNTTEVSTTTPKITTDVPSTTPTNTTEVSTITSTTPTNTTEIPTTTPKNTTEIPSTTPTNTTEVPTTTSSALTNSTEVLTTTQTNTTEVSTTTSTPPTNTTEVATTTSTTLTNSTEVSSTTPTPPTITPEVPTTTSTTPATTSGVPTTTPTTTTEVPTTSSTARTTSTTEVPTTPTTTQSTTPQVTLVDMSLRLDDTFDMNLQNPASQKYQDLERKVVKALTASFQNIPSFVKVVLRGFRSGSVIVDFQIELNSTPETEIIKQLNDNPSVTSNLKNEGLTPMTNPVAHTKSTKLGPGQIVYPEQPMTLKCTTDQQVQVKWKVKGSEIQPTDTRYTFSQDQQTLTVRRSTTADNGHYECLYTNSSGQYILWEDIDYIEPYPSIQMTPNRITRCPYTVVDITCCVYKNYEIQLMTGSQVLMSTSDFPTVNALQKCIEYRHYGTCSSEKDFVCSLTNTMLSKLHYSSNTMNVKILQVPTVSPINQRQTCYNDVFGFGYDSSVSTGPCMNNNEVGSQTAKCNNGEWKDIVNNCVLRIFHVLKEESESLDQNSVKLFVNNVTEAAKEHVNKVFNSTGNIATIVSLLNIIANVSKNITIDEDVIKNILETVDTISSNQTKPTWDNLNNQAVSQGNSSLLLKTLEIIVKSISNGVPGFTTSTSSISFIQATINDQPFNEVLGNNSEASLFIPSTSLTRNLTITTMAFLNLHKIMPSRNKSVNDTKLNSINGIIVLVSPSQNVSINNLTLNFHKLNSSDKLVNPECVFWNFDLFNAIGGWDSYGCKPKKDVQGFVTCECNHTTSFSILMSPYNEDSLSLTIITYIGLSVSVLSLVIFLIIEIIFWKPLTRGSQNRQSQLPYMRHISLVNIAVTLLIANIWFIVGAAITKPDEPAKLELCSAVAFFIHFFYLALFFWMLIYALLLLYSVTVVMTNMSKTAMIAIAFTVGYGAPLVIAVITVASTVGGKRYIMKNACWLNWDDSKALLAFTVPALTIVVTNIVVMIVVLYKMLKKRVGERTSDDKNAMAVIARFVAVLTPIFGITWGLGVGIMISPKNEALVYLFAILNSLQGFFIAVFGLLFDKKLCKTMRQKLRRKLRSSSTFSSTWETSRSNRTDSTGLI